MKLEFSLTLSIDQPVYLGTGLAIVKETIGGGGPRDATVTGWLVLNKTVDARRRTDNG